MIADWRQNAVVKSLILKGISLTLLGACATAPVPPDARLVFTANGKFGISSAAEGYSARFSWRHYADGYDIEVWGPLGQGRTRLRGDDGYMQVLRGQENLAEGTPEQVMFSHLGWSVPVGVLPHWIQGYPAPQMPYADAELDEQGRYTGFMQSGWQVSLERYLQRAGVGPEVLTPGRIVARNGLRKVTVVVREYTQ
jgi:outer membrane lipoprotein LolB